MEYVRSTGRKVFTVAYPLQYGASMGLDFPEFVRAKKMVAGKSRIFQESQETHGAVLW